MKIAIGLAVALVVAAIALVLVQLWTAGMSAELFWKLEITLGALFVIVLVVTYAVKEYKEFKSLSKGD
jgi:hypothetical protein